MMRNILPRWLLLFLLLAAAETSIAQQANMTCLSPNAGRPTTLARLVGPAATVTIPACSRVVNVNIHFILRLDGTGNWNETDNGISYYRYNDLGPNGRLYPRDTAQNGYAYARGLVDDMNYNFSINPPQGSPQGINNPAKKVRVTLNGVYFHRVSAGLFEVNKTTYAGIYYNGVPDARLFDAYGIAKDTVINIVMGGDYSDRVRVADISGIACTIGHIPSIPSSYWFKMFNAHMLWRWRQENEGNPNIIPGYIIPQNARALTANTMCHELGHLLGLIHTFEGGNSCQDINTTQGQSGNNIIDYVNANNVAISPCQLDIVHSQLVNPTNPTDDYHNYLTRSACDEVPPRAFFTMASTVVDPTNVPLDNRGTYAADSWQLSLYWRSPDFGSVRMGTCTKRGGLGQRLNLANAFGFSGMRNGDYYLEMKAAKLSGQQHIYRQSFTLAVPSTGTGDPTCNDCTPPKLPDGVVETGPPTPTTTFSTRP